MALVWTGNQFERVGGSDTEASDSEAPLTSHQQSLAILAALTPTAKAAAPPVPEEHRYARATAEAVLANLLSTPSESRTLAQVLALSMPIQSLQVFEWVDQQLDARRRVRTINTAMCWALNPNQPASWVCKKTGGNTSQTHTTKGLMLHLRMHPFTRTQIKQARESLHAYCANRERLKLARAMMLDRFRGDPNTMEVAVLLVLFQREARHFGACRYRVY